jgi:hypothetical protein
MYSRYQRFIASTTALAKNLIRRSCRGVYLLGLYYAWSKVEGVRVTEHSIVFCRGKECIAGVYFPLQTIDVDDLI